MALVGQARVRDGMRRLDEASAIATGEELQLPISLSWALCYVITACEGVGDFPRAAQWCEVMSASAERWGARHSRGVCRSAYGTVLACCGHWEAAEAELTGALRDLEAARPGMAGGGLVRLGELRARQGRVEEARELFERAGTHRLGGARARRARARGRRRGGGRRRRRTRAAAMPAGSASPACPRSSCSCARAPSSARSRPRPRRARSSGRRPRDRHAVRRRSRPARRRRLALARTAHHDARRAYEDALDHFGEAAAPYDAALARLGLARALAALGRGERAAVEAQAARDEFTALGAAREAARVEPPLKDVYGVSWATSRRASWRSCDSSRTA